MRASASPYRTHVFWERTARRFPSARRFDARLELERVDLQNAIEAPRILARPLSLYDECMAFLYFLHRFADDLTAHGHEPYPAFYLLSGYSYHFSMAVRRLVCSGQPEPATVLARSLIEALELMVAVLGDDQYAAAFAPDDPDHDENAFWRSHVAHARLRNRFLGIASQLGMADAAVSHVREVSAQVHKALSGGVHAGARAALRTVITPLRGSPATLVHAPTGRVAPDSGGVLHLVMDQAWLSGTLLLALLRMPPRPTLFAPHEVIASPHLDSLIASFLTFQHFWTVGQRRRHTVGT